MVAMAAATISGDPCCSRAGVLAFWVAAAPQERRLLRRTTLYKIASGALPARRQSLAIDALEPDLLPGNVAKLGDVA